MSDTSLYAPDELARWSGGCWNRAPAAALRGVSTHSAKVLPGSLFIALKGPRHDAHAFVPQALAAGCAAALVRGDYVWPAGAGAEAALLRVTDPNAALGRLAAGYRDAVAPRVIGITGSAGKSTVKEMTAALLAALGPTACTPGNLNNEFGLPLSLLAMPRDTRYGVFEVGMSHPGELAPLCALLRPDCGIVTTVGPVHLEAFGSVRDIAREKAALLRALPPDGIAVLDRDQEWFADLAGQAPCPVTDVSCRPGAEFVLEGADPLEGVLEVRERGAARAERLHIGYPGAHNLRNALLAAALARRLGAGWEAIREAFPRARHLPMRWECSDWNGVRIVNDAYNANPLGMRCALDTFARMPCPGRRFALLGDMLELGPEARSLHETLGRHAADAALQGLFLLGQGACDWIRQGALQAGTDPRMVRTCTDASDAARQLSETLRPGDALLLKASRGMALESVLAALPSDRKDLP